MVEGADYLNTLFTVSHCCQYSLHSHSIFLPKDPEDVFDASAVDVFSARSFSSRTSLEAYNGVKALVRRALLLRSQIFRVRFLGFL